MTDVVEKQVKAMLTRFKNEIQKASQHTAQSGSQMANGLKSASTQIQTLLTATQKLNADGSLTETRKGYDALGKSIAEVYKNGQLLSRTMDTGKGVQGNITQANQLYQQQLTYLRQLNQLSVQRLSAGNGTSLAAELDQQIATLQQQINGNKQLISQMDQQVVKRSKLVNLAAEEARLQQKLKTAQASQQTRSSNASETAELKKAEQAYKQLTNAYRQYNQARKNGDQAQQAYWSQSAQSALNELNLLEQKLPS